MLIERIDEQLLEEIQDALNDEYEQVVADWNEEYIDLENDNFDDMLLTEVFGEYIDIPLNMLRDTIEMYFPFIKDTGLFLFGEVSTLKNNEKNAEVTIRIFADNPYVDEEQLSEIELKQVETLNKELTQIYIDLDLKTTLHITHVPLEDVPESYYTDRNGKVDLVTEHDFVEIEF